MIEKKVEKLPNDLLNLIYEGESYNVEFKSAKDNLPQELFVLF